MATYKVLGQSSPTSTTNTDVYTAAAQAIVSTINVCNRAGASGTYRVAIRPAGATLANQHYLVFDATIAANATTALTLGISMAATDVLTVYASTANFSFSAFGVENP